MVQYEVVMPIIFVVVFLFFVFLALKISLKEASTRTIRLGRRGEQKTGRALDFTNKIGAKGQTLFNVYLPTTDGRTTEIDLLYITSVGIFVIESKYYKGWIFGTDTNRQWTEVLYTRKTWSNPRGSEKHSFYNPIMQNNTHINWLKKYVGNDVPMFSVSVFSNDCVFKELDLSHSPDNVFVITRRYLTPTIVKCYNKYPKILSDNDIERLYNKLLPYTDADTVKKEQHKQEVYERTHGLTCPKCGGKLVLRTARKGSNAGSQFYGCSNYPKCKYTRNT